MNFTAYVKEEKIKARKKILQKLEKILINLG